MTVGLLAVVVLVLAVLATLLPPAALLPVLGKRVRRLPLKNADLAST